MEIVVGVVSTPMCLRATAGAPPPDSPGHSYFTNEGASIPLRRGRVGDDYACVSKYHQIAPLLSPHPLNDLAYAFKKKKSISNSSIIPNIGIFKRDKSVSSVGLTK